MTTIIDNGSHWAGEEPETLDDLCAVLASEPLDRTFENFGNFILEDGTPVIRFWGNFAHVSHVFSIDSDEPAVIQRLTLLIRENQRRPDYRSQPAPISDESRERITGLLDDAHEKLEFYEHCFQTCCSNGQVFTKDGLKGKTQVKVRGSWYPVVRFNPTTVAVPNICFPTEESQRKYAMKYPYTEVQEAR